MRNSKPIRGDQGAANLLIIPAVMCLVALTLLLIRTLGSATGDSRQAQTAADAAALAAVHAWSDSIENSFDMATASGTETGFWGFVNGLQGRPLQDFADASVCGAAKSFANQNGGQLVYCQLNVGAGTVTVKVRDLSSVPETGQQVTHEATAALQPVSGVCVSGSSIGYRTTGGQCVTKQPPSSPAADPGLVVDPVPGDVPFAAPITVGRFDVQVELVG